MVGDASPGSLRIALLSPSGDAYSQTFVRAHQRLLAGKVFYYSGGQVPTQLEGEGPLIGEGLFAKGYHQLLARLRNRLGSESTARENALARSLRSHDVDVVLAEFGPTGGACVSVCRRLAIPMVVHFHGFDASVEAVLERHEDAYRSMFEYASTIVVVSRPMEATLRRLGARASSLLYNPCGPDDAFFEVRPRHADKAFLSVGRFVNKKAPHYTLLAFSQVLSEYPDAELYMCGDGALLNACQDLANYLEIDDRVRFLGVVTPPELRTLLGRVRGFVQHSVTAADGDMEGNPVAIMEASAAGVPVVSTYHAGIPEVVTHGETGLLVEEHDVDGMASHMSRLLAERELAVRLGRKAREHVKNEFRMEHHIRRLDIALAEAAAQGGRST